MKLSRRSRWAVPALALAVVAGAPALASLANAAQAPPVLPARTPAQLLAQVASTHTIPPMTGTVTESVSLGLPKLPDIANPNSVTALLTGTHTFDLWYAGPTRFRIAMPELMRETDIYREGSTAWLWQSTSNSATKFTLPTSTVGTTSPAAQPPMPLTPAQAATAALAAVGPTTKVATTTPVRVAGQPAYVLTLAPTDHRSLIGKVAIAIDAANSVPLRVEVYARGSGSPAISVGYSQLSFTAPSSGDLAFTPPPGAKIGTVGSGGRAKGGSAGAPQVSTVGAGWLTVVELPAAALNAVTGGSAPQGQGLQGATSAETQAAFSALVNDATPVHGAWGSGSLIKTSLLSLLITHGRLYLGAVEPSVLYAAAAR